jgi:nucleoside-diphosphate-sugar epimerase
VTFISARPAEARDTKADTTLTKELLGWEPFVKFDDGLRQLLREEGIEPAE